MAAFISIGCGLMLASLVSFFKSQPQIDHLFTILFPTENLKMNLCYLSWNPGWAILSFTSLALMLFFLIACYFKFMAIVTRRRRSIAQCLTLPFWLSGNLMIFIPLGMVLFRLLHYEKLTIPAFVFVLIILLWFIFRMAKGMRVMFIWTIHRAVIVLIITILVIFAGILYYYQYHFALIDYIKFYRC